MTSVEGLMRFFGKLFSRPKGPAAPQPFTGMVARYCAGESLHFETTETQS